MSMSLLLKESESLRVVLEERDAYTEKHCGRVEALCLRLGALCSLSVHHLKLLRLAAKLHDIGKVGIPDNILLKPDRFNSDEWEVMKTHAELGQRICEVIPNPHAMDVAKIVRHHHESFDGNGYPDGLSGEQIPMCSRIISVIDGYDAMTTARPYHAPRPHGTVMDILKSESGKKIDPFVFFQFEQLMTDSSLAM